MPRPNLSAGNLTSYGFAVEASIGYRPMRSLIARCFSGKIAVTAMFVLRPEHLSGTHVWIAENRLRRESEVWTYVPTMKTAVRMAERYIFDCLPLTDVGYLDLMAWRYPRLRPATEDFGTDLSWSRWSAARRQCYLGPTTTPGLTVTEVVDPGHAMVVARVVERGREQMRRWEVLEAGQPKVDGLPKRIRVSRPQSGQWTEFLRVGEPVPLPAAHFAAGPGRIRQALERRLPEKKAG